MSQLSWMKWYIPLKEGYFPCSKCVTDEPSPGHSGGKKFQLCPRAFWLGGSWAPLMLVELGVPPDCSCGVSGLGSQVGYRLLVPCGYSRFHVERFPGHPKCSRLDPKLGCFSSVGHSRIPYNACNHARRERCTFEKMSSFDDQGSPQWDGQIRVARGRISVWARNHCLRHILVSLGLFKQAFTW